MPVIGPSIRPPQEADSFLLQLTTGCSANTCTFCGAYRGKSFSIKSENEIINDIHVFAGMFPNCKRVFLMDGDALVLNNKKLIPVLDELLIQLPNIRRISSYANDYNLLSRSKQEMKELADHKLKLIYIGLESGSQNILTQCKKKSTVQGMISAVQLAQSYGIKVSVIVLLGLGGRKYSSEHIRETVRVLNAMQPAYLSFLTLMLIPGTPLYTRTMEGDFEILSSREILVEMHGILSGLVLKHTIFRSNHASNYLPLVGRLSGDKDRLLSLITRALEKNSLLRPENVRGL